MLGATTSAEPTASPWLGAAVMVVFVAIGLAGIAAWKRRANRERYVAIEPAVAEAIVVSVVGGS